MDKSSKYITVTSKTALAIEETLEYLMSAGELALAQKLWRETLGSTMIKRPVLPELPSTARRSYAKPRMPLAPSSLNPLPFVSSD